MTTVIFTEYIYIRKREILPFSYTLLMMLEFI